MKKIFSICLLFACIYSVNSQMIQTRLLEVTPANMEKFVAAASKKTQLYNSKPNQPRYLTFEIMSGKYAYNFVRVQYVDSIANWIRLIKQEMLIG